MAHNEALFLPIWWRYYAQFFSPDDIYILDHDTTDGSTSGPGFVRIKVSHPVVDWGWHRDMLQEQQHRLLKRYDIVLCTDADEIVARDPRSGDLGNYLDHFDLDFVTCRGYEILHIQQSEPPFDPWRPVLEQRRHWFFNPAYSKPLLARVPMFWHGGLHTRTDGAIRTDSSLYLIHLHRMDYELCLARHRQRTSVQWNNRDLDEGWAYQNRITEPEQFKRWFYNDSCCPGTPIMIEEVPCHWVGVV
jgi:hypothetical protein